MDHSRQATEVLAVPQWIDVQAAQKSEVPSLAPKNRGRTRAIEVISTQHQVSFQGMISLDTPSV